MPIILITGIPSSGKTTTATKLKEYFESRNNQTCLVSENDILQEKNLTRNDVYADSKIEKVIRGELKSSYQRNVNPNSIFILDGLNYIKGFRYELYCASKLYKTTQCVVHCDPGPVAAWKYNEARDVRFQYSRKIFDELVFRYEEPDSRNRWDSPLCLVLDTEKIPYDDISAALFNRKPPPPNQSTQCPPLSDTNFLYEVDKTTQGVVKDILSAVKMGLEGDISVETTTERFVLCGDKNLSMPQLLRMKRQFLVYVKSHPELHSSNIATLFVQYLNTNL